MMLALQQAQQSIAGMACDVIQYRAGSPPHAGWEQQPDPPDGYLAAGPWVCLGLYDSADVTVRCDTAWLWARPLNIDTAARDAAAHEAERREESERVKRALRRLLGDLERLGYEGAPDVVACGMAAAAAVGSVAIARETLARVNIRDLRALGNPMRIRAQRHSDLRERLLSRYLYDEENASE